jgi:16S rRNA (cytosine1402-N4)-methyltransferase
MEPAHIPVLLNEALAVLAPAPGESVLDVTAGLGGHASALFQRVGRSGRLVILDADAKNLAEAAGRIGGGDSVTAVHTNFHALPECLPEDRRRFDVIFGDLGLSSPHLDDPDRGFSFRSDAAPLDMRYDASRGRTAADILARSSDKQLADVLQAYGEVPHAMGLARDIVKRREVRPFRTAGDLKTAADERYGYKASSVLPQIFQALRIAVNGELDALETLLAVAPTLLKPGGRFGVLTYHSLEDRMVKRRFRALTTPEKDAVTGAEAAPAPFSLLAKGGVTPGEAEVAANPRARSARLRAIRSEGLYTPA